MKKLILFILFFSSSHLYGQTYRMVKDIRPGGNGADIKNPIVLNGYLYFRADNGTNGGELWKSNGTETGTQMVKDINLGAGTGMMSNYSQIVTLNNNLYFAADDGTNGIELWKSDGSEANTTMLANISAAGSAYPSNLTVVGNILYFSAIHDTYGAELWKYDPATNTTSMVKDINVGGDASPSRLINVNGTLFFAASANGFSDTELWKSDGTPQGTEMVKDINPGTSAGSMGAKFDSAVIGSTLYFIANDGSSGYELWKSDGTPQGTKMVKDIYTGPNGSEPSSLANINGTLYLGANDGINGYELWKSDGSSTGTEMVKDINPGAANANPYAFVALNGQAYFIATTADNGKELWKSNGTTTGTGLVKDFTGNAADGFGNDLLSIGGNLYFVALSNFRFRVWQYDGVPENGGPTVITDGFTDFFVSLANINVVDSKLYFLANTSDNGEELWTIDTYTLPLTLLSFNGKSLANGNVLRWTTIDEENFSGFELQRAANDKQFRTIALLPAQGRSTYQNNYQFTDNNPLAGTNYYRLKMIDTDGSFKMSENIIALDFDLNKSNEFAIWPVPVKDKLNLRNAKGTLRILSTNGQLVQKTIIKSNEISSVNVAQLPVGAYILQLQLADGQTLAKKLIKE